MPKQTIYQETSPASLATVQQSHSHILTPAHLMYMAELRIAIAEADARALLTIANARRSAVFDVSDEAQQQKLALGVWEQEGGARRPSWMRRRLRANGSVRRPI